MYSILTDALRVGIVTKSPPSPSDQVFSMQTRVECPILPGKQAKAEALAEVLEIIIKDLATQETSGRYPRLWMVWMVILIG